MDNLFGKLIASALGLGLAVNTLTSSPKPNASIISYIEVSNRQSVSNLPVITKERKFWLKKLRDCESGNSQLALNKIDKNGKSSKGLYQFQNKTWKHYVQKYDLWNWREWEDADYENNIWDGQYQERVVRNMLNDKEVVWSSEFPSCVKKLGLPPK